MNFSSHYLWEKGRDMPNNPVSVVLQQAEYGKRQLLFACVCESHLEGREAVEESGYFSERLTEWFYGRYLKNYGKEKDIEAALIDLQREHNMILQELERVHRKRRMNIGLHFSVILLQDGRFAMFQRGKCKILLLNKRYNVPQIKMWEQFDESGYCQGRIQKNIGILLCTENFATVAMQETYKEVLFLDKKAEDWRLGKRLTETWQGIDQKESVGAVYIRTF